MYSFTFIVSNAPPHTLFFFFAIRRTMKLFISDSERFGIAINEGSQNSVVLSLSLSFSIYLSLSLSQDRTRLINQLRLNLRMDIGVNYAIGADLHVPDRSRAMHLYLFVCCLPDRSRAYLFYLLFGCLLFVCLFLFFCFVNFAFILILSGIVGDSRVIRFSDTVLWH